MSTIIFDTETTGLIKSLAQPLDRQPRIIELYAMLVDANWKKQEELALLIYPECRITEEITRITTITDDMVKGQPLWINVAKKVSNFFRKAERVIGHNLTFDMDMITLEQRRLEEQTRKRQPFPWPSKRTCTVEATEHICGRRMKLGELHAHLLGEGFDGAHRAKADVEALHRCCVALAKKGEL